MKKVHQTDTCDCLKCHAIRAKKSRQRSCDIAVCSAVGEVSGSIQICMNPSEEPSDNDIILTDVCITLCALHAKMLEEEGAFYPHPPIFVSDYPTH